jgi:hypothetical protein
LRLYWQQTRPLQSSKIVASREARKSRTDERLALRNHITRRHCTAAADTYAAAIVQKQKTIK